jgi:uncharacterized protein (TIGR02001 family)
MHHLTSKIGAGLILMSSAMVAQAELAGNISISNNYIWRGLTQTTDQPAISGGLDYSHDSGLYIGTWVSNVEYAADDAFSYEHDMYAGFAGETTGGLSYDIGYLYYNYNEEANFDFSEIYASLGYAGFSLTAFVLVDTEAEESAGQNVIGEDYDFGFGEAYYISADYGFAMPNVEGVDVGLHVGYHDGDFVDAFNFADGTTEYVDWNVSVSKGGFSFMVSGTDLNESPVTVNNDDTKYVVSYGIDF